MANYILLFLGVIYMCLKAFEFEKITRLEFVILPIYSLIMFFITMNWSIFNLFLLITLLILSIFIGRYQSSRVEFEKIGTYDEYQRPVILIKKNKPYIIGWIIVFTISIIVDIFVEGSFNSINIVDKLGEEVSHDILIFTRFGSNTSWYIWLMTSITNITFINVLRRKEPLIREAIRDKDKNEKDN